MKSGGGSKDRHERIKICFVDRIPKDCMWQVSQRRNHKGNEETLYFEVNENEITICQNLCTRTTEKMNKIRRYLFEKINKLTND